MARPYEPVYVDSRVPDTLKNVAETAKNVTLEIYNAIVNNPDVNLQTYNSSGIAYTPSFRITAFQRTSQKDSGKTFIQMSATIPLGKRENVTINFTQPDSNGNVQPSSVKAGFTYRGKDASNNVYEKYNNEIKEDKHFSTSVKAVVDTVIQNSPKILKGIEESKVNLAVRVALDAVGFEPYSVGVNKETRFQTQKGDERAIVSISYNKVSELNAKTHERNARAGEMIPTVKVTFYTENKDGNKRYGQPFDIRIAADLHDRGGLDGEVPSVADRLNSSDVEVITAIRGSDPTFSVTLDEQQKESGLIFADNLKQTMEGKEDFIRLDNTSVEISKTSVLEIVDNMKKGLEYKDDKLKQQERQ